MFLEIMLIFFHVYVCVHDVSACVDTHMWLWARNRECACMWLSRWVILLTLGVSLKLGLLLDFPAH